MTGMKWLKSKNEKKLRDLSIEKAYNYIENTYFVKLCHN